MRDIIERTPYCVEYALKRIKQQVPDVTKIELVCEFDYVRGDGNRKEPHYCVKVRATSDNHGWEEWLCLESKVFVWEPHYHDVDGYTLFVGAYQYMIDTFTYFYGNIVEAGAICQSYSSDIQQDKDDRAKRNELLETLTKLVEPQDVVLFSNGYCYQIDSIDLNSSWHEIQATRLTQNFTKGSSKGMEARSLLDAQIIISKKHYNSFKRNTTFTTLKDILLFVKSNKEFTKYCSQNA